MATKQTRRAPSPANALRWEQRFKELAGFKRQFGHCRVPAGYPPNRPLANWVAQQRGNKKKGLLGPEKVRRLSALGFCWELRHRSVHRHDWDAMVAALTAFKKRYGHCDVPPRWAPNPDLATWVRNVRHSRQCGTLLPQRVRQLSKLGMDWTPRQRRWKQAYAALVRYRKRHGDCNVPGRGAKTKSLASWVQQVRRARRSGKLSAEWVKRLDAIGFIWDHRTYTWDARYAELIEFRRANGHCQVSTLSKTHRRLGCWVHAQRLMRRSGKLGRERIRRLDRIGFLWRAGTGPIGRTLARTARQRPV